MPVGGEGMYYYVALHKFISYLHRVYIYISLEKKMVKIGHQTQGNTVNVLSFPCKNYKHILYGQAILS